VRQLILDWLRLGLICFGGPAAHISVMHRVAVEERHWVQEAEFLKAMNFCMLLPGPEAHQLAVWLGWRTHGVRGGLISGTLFVLPGSLIMLAISWLYANTQTVPAVQGLLLGLKCAALSVVLQAFLRLASRVLKSQFLVLLALVSCLTSTLQLVPFPLLIAHAAVAGMLWYRFRSRTEFRAAAEVPDSTAAAEVQPRGETRRIVITLGTGLLLWWLPVVCCGLLAGWSSLPVRLGLFFSRAAVLTFGGAWAVLNYVSSVVVDDFGWLTRAEMADGLGLAETTPGPLILVVQHVGFLAGWKQSGDWSPTYAGAAAALLTTWVTFAPSFLWILLGAPWLNRLSQRGWLTAIMNAVSATAVGLIAALGIGLAGSTLFSEEAALPFRQFLLPVPAFGLLRPEAVLLTGLGFVLTFAFRKGLAIILGCCASVGWLLSLLG
jgi:chromate transporter